MNQEHDVEVFDFFVRLRFGLCDGLDGDGTGGKLKTLNNSKVLADLPLHTVSYLHRVAFQEIPAILINIGSQFIRQVPSPQLLHAETHSW
jgi:hypothetical protein